MGKPFADGGYGKAGEMNKRVPTSQPGIDVGQGDVLISAITSCTNTSNPGVMIGAGLLLRAARCWALLLSRRPRTRATLQTGRCASGDNVACGMEA